MKNEEITMPIFPEVRKIALAQKPIERLILDLASKIDVTGLRWQTAEFISGCKVRSEGLFHEGRKIAEWENDYFIHSEQHGNIWRGWLYFRTYVPGQFIRVWFEV